MKKVMSVNLGGLVFPIDDEAYDALDAYIAALGRQFAGTEGAEEIIGDIEYRIAEIFQEKLKGGAESISMAHVEAVVAVMGAPRDLQADAGEPEAAGAAAEPAPSPEAEPAAGTGPSAEGPEPTGEETTGRGRKARRPEPVGEPGPKRFFRNADDKLLGGVCSGFAAYIDADPLIVRLAFLLAVLGFGMGPLIYIVLWIVVPEAKTTSEKLQMRGEKVTVDSIEKTIRREAKDLRKRFTNMRDEIRNDPEGFEKKVEKKANDFFVEAGSPFQRLVYGAARLLSVFIGIGLLIVFLSLILGLVTGTGAAVWLMPRFSPLLFSGTVSASTVLTALLLVVAIPLVLALMGSVRLISGRRRRSGALHTIFLTVWGVALGLTLFMGARVAGEFSREITYQEALPLDVPTERPLVIKRLPTPARDAAVDERIDIHRVRFTDDSVFFGNLDLRIEPASGERFGLARVRHARGADRNAATEHARAIEHRVRIDDTVLAIDPEYRLSDGLWRDQRLDVLVEVPVGARLLLDQSLRGMVTHVRTDGFIGDDQLFDHLLRMTDDGLRTEVNGLPR